MAGQSTGDAGAPPVRMIALRRLLRRLQRCMCRCANRAFDVFDLFVRVVGPLFILLALGLFGFCAYTFFVLVLPSELESGASPLGLFVKALIGSFLLVNLLYNYLMAICLDPGAPPEYAEAKTEPGDGDEELGQPTPPKQCQRCSRLKPARTHHCSVCKRCVLKMDHHCPWINNCVGFRNYRYFCLFLLYLALACLFVVATLASSFLTATFDPRRSNLSFFGRQCVSLAWIISICIFFALCLLGGFHTYLVLTNQTTIEFHSNMSNRQKAKQRGEYYRNPYDLGRSRNFQQVFGPNDFCRFLWMLPCVAKPPTGDGLSFPSLSQLQA